MSDIYDLYKIFYEKYHKNSELFFSKQRWSELFSLLSRGRRELWRVVGITPNALLHYKENNFKKNTRGLVRGNIHMRIKTFDLFFNINKILDYENFCSTLKKYDSVVIMTKEENKKHNVPVYIKIDNENGFMFSNNGTNWMLRDEEIACLKKISEKL